MACTMPELAFITSILACSMLTAGERTTNRDRRYAVGMHAGAPAFFENGAPTSLQSYCSCGASSGEWWVKVHQPFAERGVNIFWIIPTGGYNGEWGASPFWPEPGNVTDTPVEMPEDYRGLDWQVKELLKLAPDARFFVRMMDMPPESWGKAHPDDMLVNHLGERYPIPSYASESYRRESTAYFRAVARYCERQSWAERIIGYVVYPLGEGATPLACEGFLFDQSPVMQEAFRAFLRDTYKTDAALRAAWHDETVTLERATVPGDDDFRRRAAKPVLFWPEARQVRRERDYFECQQPLFRRYYEAAIGAFKEAAPTRLVGFDAFKGNMIGWMTHPIFYGGKWKERYGDQFLATGTIGMAGLLDLPGLDIVATPHDYRCRWVGFGYDPEGIGDSIQLRGKVMMVEEDQRSYSLTTGERGLFGSLEPGEEEAVLFRNLAASLSKAHQTYPMDVMVGYFHTNRIQDTLARRRDIERKLLNVPRQDVPSVVMLVDDRAAMDTDFSAEYNDLAVIRQRIWGLNHCGVPTRTFLWDDLERANFPACHKLYLLPNCYRADARNLRLLRDKLFRDGNVIVFGPGSGLTDGETVDPAFAAAMLGMDMELYAYEYPRFVTVDNWDHPLTEGFGACDAFGDTHRYGPVLLPFERAVPAIGVRPRRALAADERPFTRLGTIALDNGKRRPGLVVKEFGKGAAGNGAPGPRGTGDYAVVFTAAVPLPARLLRNLARFSGTHVYSDEDDVVYADSRMVALHAVKPGPRSLRLPRAARVHDLIRESGAGVPTNRIDLTVEKPATFWWRLE